METETHNEKAKEIAEGVLILMGVGGLIASCFLERPESLILGIPSMILLLLIAIAQDGGIADEAM